MSKRRLELRPIHFILVAIVLSATVACRHEPVLEVMPAHFENDRVFLHSITRDGRAIRFVTDTGGGWNAIKASVARDLEPALEQGGDTIQFPDFSEDSGIPRNLLFRDGNLVVVDDKELAEGVDGFLGGRWFGDLVWEFDYLNAKLTLLERYHIPRNALAHEVRLGFQVNEKGMRTMHFPRMQIAVDDQVIDVLLDTGAKAQFSEVGAEYFGKEHGVSVGTSFISQSIFDNWIEQHPDWTVLHRAESLRGQFYSMIEVPALTVGGHTVGPVWFTARPDSAFVDYMSSMMDQTVHGALGGSAFRYFRFVVDYPRSSAWFLVD